MVGPARTGYGGPRDESSLEETSCGSHIRWQPGRCRPDRCRLRAQAATPELSVSNRLQDRREVAAGQRSYVEGFEDGRFYANGWHITGEMGGSGRRR